MRRVGRSRNTATRADRDQFRRGLGRGGESDAQLCAAIFPATELSTASTDLPFASPIINATATTTLATIGFQVAIAYPNGTLSNFYDEIGLANWMTGWNLSTSSGSALPLATPVCKEWAPALTNCPANDTGWYAVLLSSGGEWINSYGATPNGTSWSIPIDALVSHQQLVIVTPSSWNLSGDKLTSRVRSSEHEGHRLRRPLTGAQGSSPQSCGHRASRVTARVLPARRSPQVLS